MANLNTRQKKCLELLLNEKEFRSAKYLAEKLQVSDKTVLQDIKAIQEYLNPFHVTLIRKTGSGILLPEKARGNQELLNGLRSSAGEEGSVPAEFPFSNRRIREKASPHSGKYVESKIG